MCVLLPRSFSVIRINMSGCRIKTRLIDPSERRRRAFKGQQGRKGKEEINTDCGSTVDLHWFAGGGQRAGNSLHRHLLLLHLRHLHLPEGDTDRARRLTWAALRTSDSTVWVWFLRCREGRGGTVWRAGGRGQGRGRGRGRGGRRGLEACGHRGGGGAERLFGAGWRESCSGTGVSAYILQGKHTGRG